MNGGFPKSSQVSPIPPMATIQQARVCTTVYIDVLNITAMDTTSIADFIHVVEPPQAIGPELDFHQDHATSGADFTLMVGGAGQI